MGDSHEVSREELFTEFILILSRTLTELGDSQEDIAQDPTEAQDGDAEMIPVIRALPDLIREDHDILEKLFEIYLKQRLV